MNADIIHTPQWRTLVDAVESGDDDAIAPAVDAVNAILRRDYS